MNSAEKILYCMKRQTPDANISNRKFQPNRNTYTQRRINVG